MLTRRDLLKSMMMAGGFALLPLGRKAWALAGPETANRHLIVILMRGAVDGLSDGKHLFSRFCAGNPRAGMHRNCHKRDFDKLQ